jgi:hypothetical protein
MLLPKRPSCRILPPAMGTFLGRPRAGARGTGLSMHGATALKDGDDLAHLIQWWGTA